ncbi:unnamed protein product [Didymodactylos carnosus]|uniref:Uncharacterized protein n=1 Tax=Didymodactylos carnosus TaxID=1234261 RepID=A0A816AK42_9BILA|nr:unnamed protein product [Didymodactylos carnosus]CAF1595990.1 unnamed protein product [Didymodactylos carnosus]CAF4306344.1 unnamed protein product [Didymodactylos carnosus]CAF4470752.1 unnamed protein product [Didymodactylos carnosus]
MIMSMNVRHTWQSVCACTSVTVSHDYMYVRLLILRIRTTITPSYRTTVYRKPTYSCLMTKWDSFVQHQKPTKRLRIIQRPPKTIQQYFQIEDNIPHPLKSNLVYHVIAKDGNDDYVGETIRQISRHFNEHGIKFQIEQQQNNSTSQQQTNNSITPLQQNSTTNNHHLIPNQQLRRKLLEIINDRQLEYACLDALGEIQPPLEQPQPSIKLPLIPPTRTVAKKSPFYIHMFETGKRITLKDYHLLMTDKQPERLLIKEALAIKGLNPTLNKTVASTPLYIYPLGIPSTFIPDPGGYRKKNRKIFNTKTAIDIP